MYPFIPFNHFALLLHIRSQSFPLNLTQTLIKLLLSGWIEGGRALDHFTSIFSWDGWVLDLFYTQAPHPQTKPFPSLLSQTCEYMRYLTSLLCTSENQENDGWGDIPASSDIHQPCLPISHRLFYSEIMRKGPVFLDARAFLWLSIGSPVAGMISEILLLLDP